jgi:aminoglycoside 3-N-acetyltransferase I
MRTLRHLNTLAASRLSVIYDVAVRSDYQRRGIGRGLISLLRAHATEAGIDAAFVPADNEDEHALDFYSALGAEPTSLTFFTSAR